MCASYAVFARNKALGIIAAGALVFGSLGIARAAEQRVDWTRQMNVAARGNVLEKTGGCDGCDDAGAVSRQMIRSGDGYVEFRVDDPYVFWVAGLGRANSNVRFNDIDFAFRFNGDGNVDVIENGTYQGGGDSWAESGDVFRIAVVGGRVQYMKNGSVIHQSGRAPRYPLALETALGTIGARIADARIETGGRSIAYNNEYGYRNDTLARLDRDDAGAISRWEWRGTAREFDRLDTNRDGVLSARELSRSESENIAPSGVGTSGQVVVVDSRERWTDTGIYVNAGDMITFDADGTIQMSDNPDDTATPQGSRLGRIAPEAPMLQRPAGALIARVANSQAMLVGAHRTVNRSPMSGELYLSVNDDYLNDNSGQYRVTITVEPR